MRKKSTQNRARFAGLVAAAALVAASAFADSRPPKVTGERGKDRQIVSRDASDRAGKAGHGRGNRDARAEKGRDHGQRDRVGEASRGRGDRDARAEKDRDYGRRASHHAQGRVTKVQKWNDGHRVWIAGTPQPFIVPAAHWNRDRFRVGANVRVGGFHNPAGWYDYDCWNCGGDVIRGVVVGVDHRRDLAGVRLRNGEYVTVALPRRGGHVRSGDTIEAIGDWTGRGDFAAFDVDVIRRYRR